MRLLEVMVANPNVVMTRSDLIEAVWGVEFGGDERLSRGISLIRKALGDSRGRHEYIETIPRRGYRFIADIEAQAGAKAEPPLIPEAPQSKIKLDKTLLTTHNTESHLQANISSANKSRPKLKPMLVGAIATIILAGATFTFVRGPLAGQYETAKLEQGLDYVKNFTQDGAIEKSQSIFSKILSDDPDHAAARAGLALAQMREYTHLERDPASLLRAKATAEASLRSDNHLALANVAVGWARELEGDFEGALKSFDRADILDPNNIFMLEGLARTYNKIGREEDTQNTLERAISLYPDEAIFYSYSGELLLAQNSFEHAESMFRHAITLWKDNPRAYAQLAHSLHLQDRTSEAISVLQDGLQINQTALLYNNLGTYLFFQGQYEMSAEAFEKTLELDGNSHEYLYWANIADAYRFVPSRKKDAYIAYDRALELLQVELDKNPTSRKLNSRAALYRAKRGDLEKAREYLALVPLDLSLSSSEYYRATVTYELLAERDSALDMLKRALKAGYPLTEIQNDPELENMRQDKKYHILLATEKNTL